MIINDLQRLRWQILDEALRDPSTEYFMGERTKTNETGATRSLIHYVNTRLRAVNRTYSCSKRMLQNDVNLFQEKGARLEPRFRRGHKRILRYINLEWKNPLLKPAKTLLVGAQEPVLAQEPLPDGPLKALSLRIAGTEEGVLQRLMNPEVLQRQTDVEAGTVTVQVRVPVSDGLCHVLLAFGASVEVLAPMSVRDKMRQLATALLKLYKKDTQPKREPVQQNLFDEMF